MKLILFFLILFPLFAEAQIPLRPENSSVARAPASIAGLLGLGEYCSSANECASGFCSSFACKDPYYKICDLPGRYCLPKDSNCYFNSECCSSLCSASGYCVADGINECIATGDNFRLSPKECCSGTGNTKGRCVGSSNSCSYLGAECVQNSECCSLRCGVKQRCVP
jgi:hypothetical protein